MCQYANMPMRQLKKVISLRSLCLRGYILFK